MDAAHTTELLDATDTKQRRAQNLALVPLLILAPGCVALMTLGVLRAESMLFVPAVGALVASALLVRRASRTRQRWEVTHKGHRIRFENGPIFGEKLYIDDACVATGGFGRNLRLEGVVPAGDGAGDLIVAHVEARITTFRCRIEARVAAK